MCGIVATILPNSLMSREALLVCRDTLRHRGPDDAGVWWSDDGQVGLGHRRLAIIDLSASGHQPMLDSLRQHCIVFNGEIYNYRELRAELAGLGHTFKSESDTEVILAAYRQWDTRCLDHFDGMFAFALYDTNKRVMFLARDRAGEKPLYYRQSGTQFCFASELKALMADPSFGRRLNRVALDYYLTYGYVPGDHCILQDVKKLAPAHAMTIEVDSSKTRLWQYWRLPEPLESVDVRIEDLEAELEQLLGDSVKRRLIADVPLGVLLSGGVDSSLVTAFAAKASSQPIKTFTISFPGHTAYNEGPFAKLVAAHFGTQHTELAAEPATIDLLPELARQYDEPMCDSSMIPTYLVSKLVRKHCTVAIGGDGGDELFGGYQNYSRLFLHKRMRQFIPGFFRSAISRTASALLPIGTRGRNFLCGIAGNAEHSLTHANVLFDPEYRSLLVRGKRATNGVSAETFKENLCEPCRGLPGEAMALDFYTYLPEDILVKVDRASMLASLELRSPFLDHRLIEFAFRKVPNALRTNASELKILPKRLAARLLPKTLNLNRKQGFSVPMNQWMRGDWGAFASEVLTEADKDLFDRCSVGKLIKSQKAGMNNGERIFALTLFELWRREYKVALN